MMKKFLKNEKGLTLIELLAVIVILGIIAAIAIPSIGGIIQKSREDAVKADALQILNSAKVYVSSNGVTETGGQTIDEEKLAGYLDENETIKTFDVAYDGATYKLTTGAITAGNITITFENATAQDIKAASDKGITEISGD
ncbi:type II secretion system protein [Priestia flexa]|uniref:type II secretion system protein n=1 Tax=Priestia flexa TaxID=86664 RepID=UPI00099CD6D8|nr:prepilin-type N-terminal cleavage/methylation domain-containing protein [Priestia flexa]AQX53598.1 hypothetical protein BC359_04350 [Priestia flexa]